MVTIMMRAAQNVTMAYFIAVTSWVHFFIGIDTGNIPDFFIPTVSIERKKRLVK